MPQETNNIAAKSRKRSRNQHHLYGGSNAVSVFASWPVTRMATFR